MFKNYLRQTTENEREPWTQSLFLLFARRSGRKLNQTLSIDITCISMVREITYCIAIIDWFRRLVSSWRLSNTLDGAFCREALDAASVAETFELFDTDWGC